MLPRREQRPLWASWRLRPRPAPPRRRRRSSTCTGCACPFCLLRLARRPQVFPWRLLINNRTHPLLRCRLNCESSQLIIHLNLTWRMTFCCSQNICPVRRLGWIHSPTENLPITQWNFKVAFSTSCLAIFVAELSEGTAERGSEPNLAVDKAGAAYFSAASSAVAADLVT